jgi:hypothetical protein
MAKHSLFKSTFFSENSDMTSSSSNHTRPEDRFQRICLQILPIAVAAAFLWMARPDDGATSSGHSAIATLSQPAPSAGLSQRGSGDAILTSLPVSSRRLITRPIEDIRPGMRVLASNPELKETLPDSHVTPDDWRLVSLTMTKENDGILNVQLLRPLEWFLTEIVVLLGTSEDPPSLYQTPVQVTAEKDTLDYKLQQLLLGQSIYLDLPELGAQGLAKVTAIDSCPPLDDVESGRRLVTGTFRHAAANVIDVQVGSESQPFGCTDNHPFWSVDREQFVEAGQLRIGENLQSADGTLVQVTRITPRRGPPVDVFNFEVDVDHVYHVGHTGVLVHNACEKVVVVGESMTRVRAAVASLLANGQPARWYQAWSKVWPNRTLTQVDLDSNLARNVSWIRSKIDQGYQIYDIGIDPSRVVRSQLYLAELDELADYVNVIRLSGF